MRRRWRLAILLTVMSSLMSALGMYVLINVLDGQERNATKIEKTRDDVVVAKRKVDGPDSTLSKTVRRLSRAIAKLDRERREQDALIRDLRAAGARLPSVVKGGRGPAGLPGAEGRPGASATQAQVRSAVARYCEANRCGTPPTQEQVDAAIRACSAAGGCRGPQGSAGRDGKDGRDGTNGMDGVSPPPPPTLACPSLDPALRYQCAIEAESEPIAPVVP